MSIVPGDVRNTPIFQRLRAPATFYFVRHGQSDGNRRGRIMGHTDSPLSDLGYRQAQSTGRWFRDNGIQIDRIITSPLRRCRQTAEPIASESGMGMASIVVDKRLIEIDTGSFSDMTMQEIRQRMPREWQTFQVESWEGVDGAEPIAAIITRVAGYWDSLIACANDGSDCIVSVTHGGLLQWIIKLTFGVTERWMPIVAIGNCGIMRFHAYPTSYGADGNADDGIDSGGDVVSTTTDEADGYFGEWALLNYQVE